jgi:hypothetical protein
LLQIAKAAQNLMSIDRQSSQQAHRRAVRREILLPFAGGLLLIVVLVVLAASQGAVPTSGVANTLLTVVILCPLALCMLPVYILLVVAVFGMNRVHDTIGKPLRALENLTITLRERTYGISDRAARTTINLNARFAPLDRMVFSYFDRDRPKNEDNDE